MKQRNDRQFYCQVMLPTLLILLLFPHGISSIQKQPNIVFIVADDLGWDDVGFHGSPQIPTPNIDSLALSGVILNNYYVSPSSFATKSEFMTGKYATRLGVQHGVLHSKQELGLPLKEKILPQYLKESGYSTHAIGKWALGFYTEKMLPWKRGFDSFYGGLTASSSDYFTHSAYDDNYGLDLRDNGNVVHNETGHYSTELFTEKAIKIIENYDKSKPLFLYLSHQAVHSGNADDPLQVPACYLRKVKHIKNPKRKLYGGMVAALDESVLNITIALSEHNLLKNTIIIFTTNSGGAVGGMELNSGSNFPLRGSKMTVWEGGVRGVAFVYSDMINENSRVNEEMFHSTDWLPTILALAGSDTQRKTSLDGFNIWDAISHANVMSPRFEILHQFDPLQKNQCALRVGDYKIILNQDIGYYGDWYPRPAEIGELANVTKPSTLPNAKVTCDKNYPHPFLEMHAPPCDPMKKPCLFNIQWDPCEFHNLAQFMPNTLKVLLDRLYLYRKKITKPLYPKYEGKADPENNDGVWGPWGTTKPKISPTKAPFTLKTVIPTLGKTISEYNNKKQPKDHTVTSLTLPAPVLTITADANQTVSLETSSSSSAPLLLATTSPDDSEGVNATKVISPPPVQQVEEKKLPVAVTFPPLHVTEITASNAINNSQVEPVLSNYNTSNISRGPEEAVPPTPISVITPPSRNDSQVEGKFPEPPAPVLIAHLPATDIQLNNSSRVETPNNADMLLASTTSYPDVVTTTTTLTPSVADNETSWQEELSKAQNSKQPIETSPEVQQTSTQPALDVVSDQGDHVGISIKNRNATRDQTHTYSNVLEDSVESGDSASKIEMKGKTTTVHVIQNANDNPTQTIAINDEANLKKNRTASTSAITDNTFSHAEHTDVSTQNQDGLIYKSGPINTTFKNKENETQVNETGLKISSQANETTGEGKPDAAVLSPSTVSSNVKLQPEPQPVPVAPHTSDVKQPTINEPFKSDAPIIPIENKLVSLLTPTQVKLPPAVEHLPQAASLRPNKDKTTGTQGKEPVKENKSLSMKTGSETSTGTESSVGANALTEAKTDSKLPALQKPHVLATLNNIADAGGEPGKSGLSSEVAIATGSDIGPGTISVPTAQKFVKEPAFQSVEKPEFEKPENPWAKKPASTMSAGSTAGAGSETESETVVGAGAQVGSDTKIGQKIKSKDDPKLMSAANKPVPEADSKDIAVAKAVNDAPKPQLDTFMKGENPNLGSSLKALSSHAPVDKGVEFSLATGQHNDLPNTVIAGHRSFQTVSDVVSDSSNQLCGERKDCVNKPDISNSPNDLSLETPSVDAKPTEAANNTLELATSKQVEAVNRYKAVKAGTQALDLENKEEGGTQATSNEPMVTKLVAKNNTNGVQLIEGAQSLDEVLLKQLPAREKLHKFFGEIKVDNKKMFYISGTASEEKDLVYAQTDSSGLMTQNDVRKHNIGFNVMIPSNIVKQLPSSKFKERLKVESSNNKPHKVHVGEKTVIHPKSKSAIKKVFDMIGDRTRKMKVEQTPPLADEHILTSKTNIATVNGEVTRGEAGDIGATKPLRGTLIESKQPADTYKSNDSNDTVSGAATDSNSDKTYLPSNTEAGDLGSIVTLVGKVKVDRLSTKRMKHNITDEHNAHKKTVEDHNLSVKHMVNNNTETNAANVDQVAGPSNSIIVSSVIVVLIASFIVVGMAVVAVVAVVARHCRLSKRFEAS